MLQPPLLPDNVPASTREIDIKGSPEQVFRYISNGITLPDWLKKSGPVSGATRTIITKGPYSFVGATRTVFLTDGSNITEQLLEYQPNNYYSYSITGISDVLRHLTTVAYGQWWFENNGTNTHVKWTYRFVPKNFFARIGLALFLRLFYGQFMNRALLLAKERIEQQAIVETSASLN